MLKWNISMGLAWIKSPYVGKEIDDKSEDESKFGFGDDAGLKPEIFTVVLQFGSITETEPENEKCDGVESPNYENLAQENDGFLDIQPMEVDIEDMKLENAAKSAGDEDNFVITDVPCDVYFLDENLTFQVGMVVLCEPDRDAKSDADVEIEKIPYWLSSLEVGVYGKPAPGDCTENVVMCDEKGSHYEEDADSSFELFRDTNERYPAMNTKDLVSKRLKRIKADDGNVYSASAFPDSWRFEYEQKRNYTCSGVVDHSDPLCTIDFLEVLDFGKYGSVSREIEELTKRRRQMVDSLYVINPELPTAYRDVQSTLELKSTELTAPTVIDLDDDCALPPSRGIAGRRSLAGTVLVHKIAGAAAAAGLSLDEVAAERFCHAVQCAFDEAARQLLLRKIFRELALTWLMNFVVKLGLVGIRQTNPT